VKKDSHRIGPLVVTGILHEIGQSSKWVVPPYLPYQVLKISGFDGGWTFITLVICTLLEIA